MIWLDWNVVATTQPHNYLRARQFLGQFGDVEQTDYFNVLVLRVDDPRGFLEAYAEKRAADPRFDEAFSRVVPLTETFDFTTPEAFEDKAKSVARTFLPQLGGQAFHVRMNRRGFKHEMSSQGEEQFLDGFILSALEARGRPGRITFDDPDAVLDVETVGERAGMSLWTAAELARFPFLKVD